MVIVNGGPEVGKDTFIEQCGHFCDILNVSSVDPLREVSVLLGWDGKSKDAKWRKLMSTLKEAWAEYNDGPDRYVVDQIDNGKYLSDIIFVHIREPRNIENMRNILMSTFGVPVYTLLITRSDAKCEISNESDANVLEFNYDVVLNDMSFVEVGHQAKLFVYKILNGGS